MNTFTTRATTCQTFFGFQLDTLIGDGWLPANIGEELGEEAIRTHYQNIRGRGYFLVENWLLAILDTFRKSAKKVAPIAPGQSCQLTAEEENAALNVIAYAKLDPLNLQIVKYIINGVDLTNKYQAKQCGIDTRTSAAKIFHLRQAAKPEQGQSLRNRLIRILKAKIATYGGQLKD